MAFLRSKFGLRHSRVSKFGLVGVSALAKSFSCSKIGLVVASVRNSPRKRGVRLCEGARVVLGMCG